MGAKQTWTVDLIKAGFDRFIAEHGRLPTALEVDRATDLPSSRQLQRSFGGLPKIRESLGYEDRHFGKGTFRASISRRVGSRGKGEEFALAAWLVEKFGEVFVHVEKPFGSSKERLDFFVYSPEGDFGIDVFATDSRHSLIVNLNSKLRKYGEIKHPLYLVAVSAEDQESLDQISAAKKNMLPENFFLVTSGELKRRLRRANSFVDPRQKK